MPETHIVGFDPASVRNVGWAHVVITENDNGIEKLEIKAGTLVIEQVDDPWQALWPMFFFADTFIQESKPELVIMEKTSSFSGGFITGQVSNSMGAILAACGKNQCTVQFVYPSHVKKVIVGKGRATKSEMKRSVAALIEKYVGKKPKFDSEHAYDALGNVFCWLLENKFLGENWNGAA